MSNRRNCNSALLLFESSESPKICLSSRITGSNLIAAKRTVYVISATGVKWGMATATMPPDFSEAARPTVKTSDCCDKMLQSTSECSS